MNVKFGMELLSDTIFRNGMSVPGGEDISVLRDREGFPYYKGSTLKGIFREELERYLSWQGKEEEEIRKELERLLGKSGSDEGKQNLVFSDFCLSDYVKDHVLKEMEAWEQHGTALDVLDVFTNVRTFTSITEDGIAKRGSLHMCRCVDAGLCFHGEIFCEAEDEELVEEVLGLIKWIGTMRNRGFGKVRFSVESH